MRLTIIAVGSRGDVQPCVALGCGLSEAGNTVRVVTLASFEPLVRRHGLDSLSIPGDAEALTNALVLQQVNGRGSSLLKLYRAIMRTFGAIAQSYVHALSDPVLRESDAILSQLPGGFYGYDLAEHLQIPYFALSVIPQELTAAWPMPLLPSTRSLGRRYNRLTYRLGQQLAWHPFRRSVNAFRRQVGLPPASFWWGNMRRMARQEIPVLQGFSEHVIPTQSEWGPRVHTTGYWTLDETDWRPDPDLVQFLDAGDRPFFIGFGSMPVPEPARTTALILETLERSGKRGILHAGWAHLGTAALPETVFMLEYAPYGWLFPRLAGIIHHGGSGTTGLALRSGVPSLVVPFTADQPFWGKQTHDLGVGPPPIPFTTLTADKLAVAISMMASNLEMQRRAAQTGELIKGEDGVRCAVSIIDELLAQM